MHKLDLLLKSKSVIGLECILSSDGIQQINYVVLKKEKDRLVTSSSKSSIKDIKELKSDPIAIGLNPAFPVFLVLNGKGIMNKKLPLMEGENDASLLNKILPAANPNDFYLQKSTAEEGSHIVSVIRKSTADVVLNNLIQNGFQVISCSLGPFCFQSMFPLLDNDSTAREVIVSGYKLSLGSDTISNFEPSDKPNTDIALVGGEKVMREFVAAFASAVQYFISFGTEVMADIPSVKEGNEDFRQKKIFQTTGMSALVLFLVALILNFVFFSHLSRRHNELDEKVSMNEGMLQQYEKLKAEVGQKQAFLDKTGLLEGSRTSYYADKIALDIPNSIQLSQLNVFPIEKKSNDDDQDMSFTAKNILISGSCKKSTELNEWMGILKRKTWIKDVSIVNFTQDKSEIAGSFSLDVMMK